MRTKTIDQQTLQAWFDYSEQDGCLIWRHGKHAGRIAGGPTGNHWRIKLDGQTLRLQYAVWMYHGKQDPSGGFIQSINGNPRDTRIENLELVLYKTRGTGGIPSEKPHRAPRTPTAAITDDDLDERIKAAVRRSTSSLRADIKALKAEIETLKADVVPQAPSVPEEQPVNQSEPEDNDDPDPW